MTDETIALPRDYTLPEAAAALRCSPRWLRDKIKSDHLPHGKRGHKFVFSVEQVEAIRQRYIVQPLEQSVTTGRKRRTS